MPPYLAKALLLVAAGLYIYWDWVTVCRVLDGHPRARELSRAVFGPAVIMTLALASNALVFMQTVLIQYEMVDMYQVLDEGGSVWFELARRQVAVLAGTASLMHIVRRALRGGYADEERPAMIVGVKVQARMYRRLAREHWWAVLGLGTVFGVAGGSGPVLLLAFELTLMWAGSEAILRWKRPV